MELRKACVGISAILQSSADKNIQKVPLCCLFNPEAHLTKEKKNKNKGPFMIHDS